MSDLPWTGADSTPTRNGAKGAKCRCHEWTDPHWAEQPGVLVIAATCSRCGAVRDPAASRRGRSSDRLGKDQERRIERVYGPRKVGEYGDAVDHLGRDFKWQSKATRAAPPLWLECIGVATFRERLPEYLYKPMGKMAGIGGARLPLVIRSFVHVGTATRDWIFVPSHDWLGLHGFGMPAGFIVIPGDVFLDIHGRDEE